MTGSWIFSILENSHSLLHSGQLLRVRSHLEMQSRWKTCPQFPHAMLRPSSEATAGFAWYSIEGSCRLFRQIAHVSVQMDHDQTATAFHCVGEPGGGGEGRDRLSFEIWRGRGGVGRGSEEARERRNGRERVPS